MPVARRAAALALAALALTTAAGDAAARRTQVFSLRDLENGDAGPRITSAAKKVPGVTTVRFDLLAVEAAVTMREGVADSAIIGALHRAGFEATAGAGHGSYRPFEAWPAGADVALLTDNGAAVGPLASLRVPGKYTVFDVFARWCGPCRDVDALLRAYATTRSDIAVRKLNVVTFTSPLAKELASKLVALPHVVVFTPDGKRTDVSGFKPEKLRAALGAQAPSVVASKPPSAVRTLGPSDSMTATMDTLGISPDSLIGKADTGPDSMAVRARKRRGDGPHRPAFGDFVYYEEAPVLQYMPRPIYSSLATEAGHEGVVTVQALVDTLGMVVDARVVRSIPLLDQAAITAVRQSRWRPAYNNRRPVPLWVEVPVRFSPTGR